MAKITLDALRETVDEKYSHTEIVLDENTTVVLLNMIRLPKEVRKDVLKFQKELEKAAKEAEKEDSEVDAGDPADQQEETARELIRKVARHRPDADKLLAAIDAHPGDELALLLSVINQRAWSPRVEPAGS